MRGSKGNDFQTHITRLRAVHRNFYCRIKLPKEDRFRIKHDVPVFSRPFRQVAEEYIAVQQRRAKLGEVAADSVKNVANRCRRVLDDYVGSTQIHLTGQDRWSTYSTWRRENGKGRTRAIVSDATIGVEMGAFNAVMSFAISKRYVPASHRFQGRPKLKTMRRDEFTTEEYRKLHSFGRKWIKAATSPQGTCYRTMCYNLMLIMCNTGMRPPEAKNLRWRDITRAKDRNGREIVVLFEIPQAPGSHGCRRIS